MNAASAAEAAAPHRIPCVSVRDKGWGTLAAPTPKLTDPFTPANAAPPCAWLCTTLASAACGGNAIVSLYSKINSI
jgi:hypothetical protein